MAARLMKEYRSIVKSGHKEIQFKPKNEETLTEWDVYIMGPKGSPFEGSVTTYHQR